MSPFAPKARLLRAGTSLSPQRTFHALMLIASLGFAANTSTQEVDEYTRGQIFNFEQCANLCQVELDKGLFACGPYREDKSKEAPESCFVDNYDRHDRCLKACPVDPRQ